MKTSIVKREIRVDVYDEEFSKVLRTINETDCRLSVLKSLISDPDIPENIAVKLSNEYAEKFIESNMICRDYIKKLASNDCIEVVNWFIHRDLGLITICERHEVKE